tara:strand:+ start:58 stop:315 length:258 start_codon:yes stop_codon:yes gene_type:complete
MANRYFNKQVAEARTPLEHGGRTKDKRQGPKEGTTPDQLSPGPKGGPRRSIPRFKKKDTTDREKIIRDRIRRKKMVPKIPEFKKK